MGVPLSCTNSILRVKSSLIYFKVFAGVPDLCSLSVLLLRYMRPHRMNIKGGFDPCIRVKEFSLHCIAAIISRAALSLTRAFLSIRSAISWTFLHPMTPGLQQLHTLSSITRPQAVYLTLLLTLKSRLYLEAYAESSPVQ